MLYTELLKKHGLTADTVSAKTRAEIKRYLKLSIVIDAEKTKLGNIKDERKKIAAENEISIGEANLSDLNDSICRKIEHYAANIDVNRKKAENLANARSKKDNAKGDSKANDKQPPVTPIDPAAGGGQVDDHSKSDQKSGNGGDDTNDQGKDKLPESDDKSLLDETPKGGSDDKADDKIDEKPKKKGKAFAIIGGIVLTGILAAVGINYVRNRK